MLEGNPDLYGPFWIATTVVFILFLGGTISKYLATTGQEPFVYDFKLLSGTFIPSLSPTPPLAGPYTHVREHTPPKSRGISQLPLTSCATTQAPPA